jgi:hypothetical protein
MPERAGILALSFLFLLEAGLLEGVLERSFMEGFPEGPVLSGEGAGDSETE